MKTNELAGPLLDYYVGLSLGKNVKLVKHQREDSYFCVEIDEIAKYRELYNPSENWDMTGPLLDKKKIDLSSGLHTASLPKEVDIWVAMKDGVKYDACGPDPLTAVCRLIVWMEYGDNVPDMDE